MHSQVRWMLVMFFTVVFATAQCTNPWDTGAAAAGVSGTVHAIQSWDPDGAGPAPSKIVVAGSFQVAGSIRAANIAAFDPATGAWTAFGSGMDAAVHALTVTASGDLVAGGFFATAGGVAVGKIARWTGSAWAPIGGGLGTAPLLRVHAFAAMPNGDLVAGGWFSLPGAAQFEYLVRWDGIAWGPIGSAPNDMVTALHVLPGGDLVAGGFFTSLGAVAANGVARWNGLSWSPLGVGLGGANAAALALVSAGNGDLFVAGQFTSAGGAAANHVARWDGLSWSPLGAGAGGHVYAVAILGNGDVVLGGGFAAAGGVAANGVARWNGAAWVGLGVGVTEATGNVYAIAASGSGAWIGGYFEEAGGVGAQGIARWDGTNWSALGNGLNNVVTALAPFPDGSVVVGGAFLSTPGGVAARIARFDGTTWWPLGSGLDDRVLALLTLPNGDLIVGGSFSTAGGVTANHIARWNGTSWSALGAGPSGPVRALAQLPGGDIVAAGAFSSAGGVLAANIARWDGTAWSALGAGLNASVLDLEVLPNGNLVAGGSFTTAGGVPALGIAQWNGVAWSGVGGGLSGMPMPGHFAPAVHALAVLPNGDLLAGGPFLVAGGVLCEQIARWDGALWHSLGNPTFGAGSAVASLLALPDGSALVGGLFPRLGGFAPGRNVARWHPNSTWSSLGNGVDYRVVALAQGREGTVNVGGWFATADDQPAVMFARLSTTCPALEQSYGSACTAPSGTTTLRATALPWLASTFQATSTGSSPTALVLAVSGLSAAAVPLSTILSQAVVGCTLLVTPDHIEVAPTLLGSAVSGFAVPSVPILVGAVFRHQHVALDFNLAGDLVAVTSSNAVALTIGQF